MQSMLSQLLGRDRCRSVLLYSTRCAPVGAARLGRQVSGACIFLVPKGRFRPFPPSNLPRTADRTSAAAVDQDEHLGKRRAEQY